MNTPMYGSPYGGPPEHHHHPLSDRPCHNSHHDAATADPDKRNVFATVYVDAVGLLTMTPWVNLDAARQCAEERRGAVVAFPVVADYTRGPSMASNGSWPAAKQTDADVVQAAEHHAAAEDRRRAIAAAQEQPTFGGFFAAPAGFTPGDPPAARASDYDDTHRPVRSFMYDPEDGAGVPFRITEVQR